MFFSNGFRCLNVILPMDGQLQKKFIIAISVSFTGQITPKPEIQEDLSAPAKLFYRSDSLEPVSIYETGATQTILAITSRSKSLKLKCPVGRTPEKMNTANLPIGMKGFYCNGNGNGPVEFRFESRDALLLRITNLERKFTFLPWTGEVQVTESYELVHEGPKQPETPSFSRVEFGRTLQKTRGNLDGLQIIPQILITIPSSAHSIIVRDEVGIIWNDKKRSNIDAETEVISVPLRFPLIGGMSAAFDFKYMMSASEFIKPFQASSSPFKKLIHTTMFKTLLDVTVDKFKLTFVLPEDSDDIEYELGTSKPVKVIRRTYRTYFSTTGEKEISFEFEKLTREDLEKQIAVLFNFPFWGNFRKPLVAFSTIVFLLIGALYLNRLDLSLRQRASKSKNFSSSNLDALKNLFQKRREILMNYEDLIAGNVNTRPNSEQVKSDMKLRLQLEDQLNYLQNSIFEKIKNSPNFASNPQKNAMNSMALKRLYDDQGALCKKILIEISGGEYSSLSDSTSSLGANSSSSNSINFNSIGSIGNFGKMSKSGSADFMTTSGNKKKIENFTEEAVKIDLQISEYESKFMKNN